MVRALLNRSHKWPFFGRDDGQTLIEYSLMLAFIAMGLISILGLFGGNILQTYYTLIVDFVTNAL